MQINVKRIVEKMSSTHDKLIVNGYSKYVDFIFYKKYITNLISILFDLH